MVRLYNTLTRTKETFEPLVDHEVKMYTCGPTVYDYAHIGNLRTYIFEDILRRVLRYNDYRVTHVMNITDVGHLTDDGDQGEDKMEKGSAREGKTAWEIAEFYTKAFQHDLADLNILEPMIWCKATDHISEQIALVQTLIDKGFTYETSDGIYFDTTKLSDYGKLAQLDKQELKAGARVDMGEKKHPHDFALWKFSPAGAKRQMEWDAPFAHGQKGFPGWHIECSAMATKYLGQQFDIHCGGVDHIPVHHTNEIAQTEAAAGIQPWVRFWMHGEFLLINEGRMGKSEGNFLTLQSLQDKKIDPIAFRYFVLQAHYRKQLNFTWEALEAAHHGLENLRDLVANIPEHVAVDPTVRTQFIEFISDDLNIPEAMALLWIGLKKQIVDLRMVIDFDKVLGLKLHDPERGKVTLTPELERLLGERKAAREAGDWLKSDLLRDELKALGYSVEDTSSGQKIKKT